MSDRWLWILLGIIAIAVAMLMFNDSSGQTGGLANSDFASVIWYGSALVVVLSAFLLRQSMPMSGMLGHLAIWAVIFLVGMVLYQILGQFDMLPENFRPTPPPAPSNGSGTGITASLMNGVDRGLHL